MGEGNDMGEELAQEPEARGGLDRREFVKRGVALSVAGAGLMSPASALAALSPKQKHGGRLVIATTSGGTSDSFDPQNGNSPSDALRTSTVFDPLVRFGPNFTLEPGLALKWTPNKNATVWEIELRPGVHWHDGKPFTADDVIYSLRRLGNPSNNGSYAVTNVLLHDLKKLSPTLLRVPLKRPNGRLLDLFLYFNSAFIVQNGAKDFTKPIGTGAFKLKSWTPGQQSVAVANRSYWDSPRPWVDQLEILSIVDPEARMNAVLGGQANWNYPVAFPLAVANKSNPAVKLLTSVAGPVQVIYMDVTQAPFTDPRVREALKLVVDRGQMIDIALNGYGVPQNDIPGNPKIADYDRSLPQRQKDIGKAMSLLKDAGQSNLTLTLQTADIFPGQLLAAQAFAQQAKAAGITVNVTTVDPGAYLDPTQLFGKMAFAQDSWPLPALSYFYSAAFKPGGNENESHWNQGNFWQTLQEAIATPAGAKRQQLWNRVQSQQYNEGGLIVWAARRTVEATAPNVVVPRARGWVYGAVDFRYSEVSIA